MEISKINEKLIIWMHRNSITQQELAKKLCIARQTLSKKIQENSFEHKDISILKSLGFNY